MNEAYPDPVKVYREYPLQLLTPSGQIIRGSCDLVWETNDGCALVDYKSYQGGAENIIAENGEHYAGIYTSQLKTYRDILEAAGKKVIVTLIYYAVSGIIVKVSID